MLEILLVMVAGIAVGFVFRHKKTFIQKADKLSGYAVLLLLYFLGVATGINQKVMNNMTEIGGISFALVTGSILGSVIVGKMLIKIFSFDDHEK